MPGKSTTHEELVETAEAAIQEVFGDTSVDRETTADSLNGLKQIIEDYLATL